MVLGSGLTAEARVMPTGSKDSRLEVRAGRKVERSSEVPAAGADYTPQATGKTSKSRQAARRTAAARPISAVPTRTMAASSRIPGSGIRTCWTATVGVVDSASFTAGAAIVDDAAATLPMNTREARYLRITLFLTSAAITRVMPQQNAGKTATRYPTLLTLRNKVVWLR